MEDDKVWVERVLVCLNLPEHVRPGVDAAPWVCEEIKKLANTTMRARERVRELKKELRIAQDALSNEQKTTDKLRKAIAFAACTIKSGESWSQTCEEILCDRFGGK